MSTVPEIDSEQPKPPASATIVTQAPGSSSGGILALAGEIYGFMKEKIALQSLRKDTQAVYEDNKSRSQAIREAVKDLMQQKGSDLAGGKVVNAAQPTFDSLLAQMKDYSKLAVALSQLNIALKNCNGDLADWSEFTGQHIHDLAQGLIFRLAILAVIILGLSALSMLAGRATKRYVLDDRRRKQLRTIRKGILATSIGLVVFLAFFTDFEFAGDIRRIDYGGAGGGAAKRSSFRDRLFPVFRPVRHPARRPHHHFRRHRQGHAGRPAALQPDGTQGIGSRLSAVGAGGRILEFHPVSSRRLSSARRRG